MKKSFLLSVCCLAATLPAQQPWQHLQNPTAAQVLSAWNSPPPEYGPEPYYGLNGPVDETVIHRDLDTMKTLGYQAVTVQAGYNMPFAYLSPEYFAFFRTFVIAAKQRGMRVWIVDDAGYPSGFAGGKFSSSAPDLRMQALVVASKISAPAGTVLQQPLTPATVAISARNDTTGEFVSIPITSSAIHWTAPAGSWTVFLIEHQFHTSPTRSDTNPHRVKDASQSLEDYLDPAATAQFLAFTHQQYLAAVGNEFGHTILGFRGDEPDYSISGLPWTPRLFDTFQALKGYDIRPFLASFLQPRASALPLTSQQARAHADFYDVFSQLFRDGFFKPQALWCADHHLEYQVHLNHEELEMQLTRSEGSFFRDMQFVQVPGIDAIWHQIWTDTISDYPRLASSVAHLYGHPRAFTESFAAYRPEPDIALARYILNEQFVRGINLVETMYLPASTPGSRPGSPYMQDPAFPALLTYVRRTSFLLSMGRPAASVALYLPSASLWLGDDASDTAFVASEQLLSERQIDFDIIDEDALASSLIPGHASFTSASGNAYSTVILPSPAALSEAALTRLRTFASTGGKVLFLGRTPTLIYGRTFLDARPASPQDFAFASVETSAQLPTTPTPPAQPPATPPAPQAVPAAIAAALDRTIPTHTVTLETRSTVLRIMHRRLQDADLYVLFNEGPTVFTQNLTFATSARHLQRCDAQTATINTIPAQRLHGQLQTHLALQPYELQVILAR